MKTIRNTKLFNEIKDLTGTDTEVWETLFDEDFCLKDNFIPTLHGGLDHVDRKKTGIYFHDIGCNGKDNSFVIRPEKENKYCCPSCGSSDCQEI
jgi:hypothetical protein